MNKNQLKAFAKITLSTYAINDFDLDLSIAETFIAKELQKEFEELNNTKVKEARLNFFQVPNTTLSHYDEKIVKIKGKGNLICGIRHLNSNADNAFIDIKTDFYTSKKDLVEIYYTHLQKTFKVFKPKYLRYYSKNAILSNEINLCCLVQKASIIKNEILWEKENSLNLISPINQAYYKWYVDEYNKFHQNNKTLKDKVPINSIAEMEESNQANLLKIVQYKGEEIGLIASLRKNYLGHNAIYFIDFLLKDQWKGKGFAKAIQRKYINEFANENDIIWGTIDNANKSSMATAIANKRKAVRFENFIRIEITDSYQN